MTVSYFGEHNIRPNASLIFVYGVEFKYSSLDELVSSKMPITFLKTRSMSTSKYIGKRYISFRRCSIIYYSFKQSNSSPDPALFPSRRKTNNFCYFAVCKGYSKSQSSKSAPFIFLRDFILRSVSLDAIGFFLVQFKTAYFSNELSFYFQKLVLNKSRRVLFKARCYFSHFSGIMRISR